MDATELQAALTAWNALTPAQQAEQRTAEFERGERWRNFCDAWEANRPFYRDEDEDEEQDNDEA